MIKNPLNNKWQVVVDLVANDGCIFAMYNTCTLTVYMYLDVSM
jgi:hypothetical protein